MPGQLFLNFSLSLLFQEFCQAGQQVEDAPRARNRE